MKPQDLARMIAGVSPRASYSISILDLAMLLLLEAEPMSVGAAGTYLGVAQATASETVDTLLRRGLIERGEAVPRRHPRRGQAPCITLRATAKGIRLLRGARRPWTHGESSSVE